MTDFVQQGVDAAEAKDIQPAAVLVMGFQQIHDLCGKDPAKVDEVFAWESVREQVALKLNERFELECEDGTIVKQGLPQG